MELIILAIVVTVIKSIMDSNKAKDSSSQEKTQQPKTTLEDFLKSLGDQQPKEVATQKATGVPQKHQAKPRASYEPKKQPKPQVAATPQLTIHEKLVAKVRKTEREKHQLVTASVKPIKPILENDEPCEHRMELNPNVHRSKQETVVTKRIKVEASSQQILQGVIWSEILGKPKALARARR